jgi:hypothetical protein
MGLGKSLLGTFVVSACAVTASAQVYPGTGVGAIPDGLAGTPPQFGAPLVVSFAVSGLSGNVTSVGVEFALTHTFVGDVEAILAAPGGAPTLAPVSRIGVQTATSFGDSSNYSGLYGFEDASAAANIWTVALAGACGDGCNVAPAIYRSTAPGGAGQTNPPPVTSFNTVFGGLTPAQANGTWTLTFRDAAAADLGTVTVANLFINTPVPVELQSFGIE